MALGLTLIFSILGIVSFSHGEFYMVGGILVYYFTAVWFPGIHPLLAIAMACAVVFAVGAAFERMFLTPMYTGRIDRPVEYGILITFGLAFTLQYFVQALAGSNPVKARRLDERPAVEVNQDRSVRYENLHDAQAPARAASSLGGSSIRRLSSWTECPSNSAPLASEIAPSARARKHKRSKRMGCSPGTARGSL